MAINSLGLAAINGFNRFSDVVKDNSANGSYITRAAARNHTIPEDRRMDYFFRDAFMTVITAYFFELCNRTTDAVYKSPKITQVLELNKLAEIYQQELKKKHPDLDLKSVNYRGLDDTLRNRLLKASLKTENFHLLPDLLTHDMQALLAKEPHQLTGDERIRAIQARTLIPHLQRKLHYKQYLEKQLKLPEAKVAEVVKGVETCFKEIEEQLKNKAGLKSDGKKWWQGLANVAQSLKYERRFMRLVDSQGEAMTQAVLHQKFSHLPQATLKLIEDGLRSKWTQLFLKRIDFSAAWPKMTLTLLSNIAYFGIVGNWLDFNVVQPWQKKISEEHGGVKELVAPAYQALIPGIITTAGLSYLPLLKKLGPAARFLITGTTGLAVYCAASYILIMNRLKQVQEKDAAKKAAESPAASTPQPTGMAPIWAPPKIAPSPQVGTLATGASLPSVNVFKPVDPFPPGQNFNLRRQPNNLESTS